MYIITLYYIDIKHCSKHKSIEQVTTVHEDEARCHK